MRELISRLSYHLLFKKIRVCVWSVNVFAIEMGARVCCASNGLPCLLRLGITSKLANTTVRDVSMNNTQSSYSGGRREFADMGLQMTSITLVWTVDTDMCAFKEI